jgi:hypothetical protein
MFTYILKINPELCLPDCKVAAEFRLEKGGVSMCISILKTAILWDIVVSVIARFAFL